MTYPPQWNPPGGPPQGGDPFQHGGPPPPYGHNPFGVLGQPPHGQPPQGYPPQGYPQPGWGPYGEAPPLGGPPPRRSNTPWIVGTIAVVAVITVLVSTLLWQLNSGDDDTVTTAATTTSATTTAPTTTTTTTTTSSPTPTPTVAPAGACEGFKGGPGPTTPAGWSTVVSPRGLLYDVPPGWTVHKCGTLIGWEKPCADGPFGYCPIRTMSGAATLPTADLNCDVTWADAGVPGAKNITDINEAVRSEATLVSDIYTSKNGVVPQVSLSPPRNLTVGGAPAVQIVATVTGIEADSCHAPKVLHSMLATTVPGQEGSVLFIVALSQDAPGAPDGGLMDQMVGTLRAAEPA
ncbi:hypothetical protein [Mycolicibacterium confluentis]|uniref:DUF8017 domain-containing protein n=1 Tax=Mycolicibacterium confluentis TaxID=28047 RepID=A0A7I7Y4G3_9MYCO|nr:hypothetical protein [Mycolicibacterium confluentis]MCV7318096.1 hypothetical protein [Mycolicibacterium confluentis]BBZ36003.1 hypothetical protein MCNF_46080 [Mycolicibacterium confluentis]